MTVAAGSADAAKLSGKIETGGAPVSASKIFLYAAGTTRGGKATLLGKTRAGLQGDFSITYSAPSDKDAVLYLIAKGGRPDKFGIKVQRKSLRFATVLGSKVPSSIVLNERTTVATAYAMARFIDGKSISGVYPGPQNAAGTLRNLVNIRTGGIGDVLGSSPNGSKTQTMAEFNSLSNMLAGCVHGLLDLDCKRLFKLAKEPGGKKPKNTLQAMLNIAHYPGRNVRPLYRLSKLSDTYGPVLPKAVKTWTIALVYDGGGGQIDGPGNMVFDSDGTVWIGNNYDYQKSPHTPACGGETLIRLTPTGENYPGAPYTGGGIYGVGFGIVMDPEENVWTGNFGFKGTGCTINSKDNSASLFNSDGEALSPNKGYTQGNLSRVQGMAADPDGNIWFASCGNDSVTVYPDGDPSQAINVAPRGMRKPFAAAVDGNNDAWFTSNTTNRVFKVDTDGNVLFRSDRRAGGLKRPMGIAIDSQNNAWVSNSGVVAAPCYKGDSLNILNPRDASVTMFTADGKAKGPYTGGGVHRPWGIAVDGDDTVWVANFGGTRVTQLCGVNTDACPPGTKTGEGISPKSGYTFDGLTRNTAVQIDASGNVWLANNWLPIPYQTNPGGKSMVVFVGLAAPVKTPVIGPPQKP